MKNDQGLKWAFIVSLVLFVGCLVGNILQGRGSAERETELAQAKSEAKASEDKARGFNRDLDELKSMIGHAPETTMEDIKATFDGNRVLGRTANDFGHEFPNTMDRTYENMLTFMYGSILAERDRHDKLLAAHNNMRAELAKSKADAIVTVDEFKKNADDTNATLQAERGNYQNRMSDAATTITTVEGEREEARNQAMVATQRATLAVDTATVAVKEAQGNMENMGVQLAEYRNPNFDAPDGNITFVNSMNQTVRINRGSADNLRTRMTFSVYDPSVSNIAIADKVASKQSENLKHGHLKDDGICEVCLRMKQLNVSKANIEIIEILGPHSALARILVDELANPIAPGDIIHTPLWNPGETQKFALIGDMKTDYFRSEGRESIETLKAIIALNGGEVAFWVDKNGNVINSSNQIVPRDQINDLLRSVSFLIVGDTREVADTYFAIQQIARSHGTVEMTLHTLLRQMGVSPMSTVTGFGKDATETDLRIKPTGVPTVSNGAVSPIYLKDQVAPSSQGRVSDLYEKGSQQQKPVTGSDSDLFRKRTIPGVSQ